MRLSLSIALVPLYAACGSAAPSDSEIYYAAALRPGVELATSPAERLLLSRLHELAEGALTLEGERFELGPSYASASGRVCRRVRTTARERLACAERPGEHTEGAEDAAEDDSATESSTSWTFVPDPFGASSGADVPVPPATYDGTATPPVGAVPSAPLEPEVAP
ncbi:MAG: hypothetical protein MUE69_15595 [Myxococcota bacterium]|jgi:hypothetical protein|nr:hypothetical protein [Myxococcota bacterium]